MEGGITDYLESSPYETFSGGDASTMIVNAAEFVGDVASGKWIRDMGARYLGTGALASNVFAVMQLIWIVVIVIIIIALVGGVIAMAVGDNFISDMLKKPFKWLTKKEPYGTGNEFIGILQSGQDNPLIAAGDEKEGFAGEQYVGRF